MAHGERAARLSNRLVEYWKPRPGNRGGGIRGRLRKLLTHRIERRVRCCECGGPWIYGYEQPCDSCAAEPEQQP